MIVGISLSLIIGLMAWKFDVLSAFGSFTAFLISIFIIYSGGTYWLLILISFLLFGYLSTLWKFEYKRERGLSESETGKRNVSNVLGNGLSPLIFSILGMPVAFCSSISTVMADTLASEVGVTSDKAWMITSLEKVEAGTNGAISVLGLVASLFGSVLISIVSYFLLNVNPLIVILGGFMGCQVDSLLGATLERRGYLNKSLVNLIASFSGGLISYLLILVI